ncbi:MAG TPA: hypothetical protein VNN22_06680 [Verrucomicrobiae bacterium]|nr:hypothetical protein [Verrucomicrobiae bacterium]
MKSRRAFARVGKAMIKAAIELSRAQEYKGRIGLHSLSASEKFYRDKCGMADMGMDEEKEMVCFEMTEAPAKEFLLKNP